MVTVSAPMFTEKALEVGDAAGRAEMHASASSRTRNGNASTKFEFRGSIALKFRIARSRWELAKNGVLRNFDFEVAENPTFLELC